MKAAVLHTLGEPPRFEDFPDPEPDEGEELVRVRAASLKNVDKSMAEGSHYGSHRQLPAICGTDGIAMLEDGSRVFCGGCLPPYGMMAELAAVPGAFCLPVPGDLEDAVAAALPNPALSSWLPLVWRARLEPGETVLILGATGVSGKLAIQIAKHLGAGRVVAAGRNEEVLETLADLGADAAIHLDQPDENLATAFVEEAARASFDVVLDYVWGRPTEVLLESLTGHDVMAESPALRLVEIGDMAGPTITLPAAALRSSGLEIHGSGGGGTVPMTAILETVPRVWELAAAGELRIDVDTVPLADVERAWRRTDLAGRRLVLIP